jgi:hypothetical protein
MYIQRDSQQLIHLQLLVKSNGGRFVSAIIAIKKNKKEKMKRKKLKRALFLDNKVNSPMFKCLMI